MNGTGVLCEALWFDSQNQMAANGALSPDLFKPSSLLGEPRRRDEFFENQPNVRPVVPKSLQRFAEKVG